jgi:hypothetical protein
VLEDYSMKAGHVFGARALVTVEMTLLLVGELQWLRQTVDVGNGILMAILVPVLWRLRGQLSWREKALDSCRC